MNSTKLANVVLIVLRAPVLAHGGFSYTKDNPGAEIRAVGGVTVQEKRIVNVPLSAEA